MRMYDLILKKRSGLELSWEEIEFIINGYMQETVPDYQVSAFAMAVFFQGMSPRETADLTMAIVRSGEQVDLSAIHGIKVDKHSTGGVGDKTTLVLAPLVAAAGIPVAKMSGRGLGHTGGTIDKLESIAGFKVSLSKEEFINNVNQIKVAVVGQTGNLAPADKKLYALRDVTATVDSIPLIASSVMSKKIASGADAIVLDVKTGSGAFMKKEEDAVKLARSMVDIGTQVGRKTVAVVTDMDQPLGNTVGNALEVREAIETLQGNGPADLTELTLVLGGHMLALAGAAENAEAGRERMLTLLRSGAGIAKLKEMVRAQGGSAEVIERPELLPQARKKVAVAAPATGFVAAIQAEQIGIAAMTLGAGRETKESTIDLAVGLELKKKAGDKVQAGETLAVIYANGDGRVVRAKDLIIAAYSIDTQKPGLRPLVHSVVEGK